MVGFLGLTPGSVFAGDFEVRRVIARGGMGAVYAVWDRVDGAERALKLLLPELVADERMRERFTREARVHQQMQSQYVPKIYRVGIDERSGMPFISMDLLNGVDLRKHVDTHGAVTPREAQPILEQIGEALGEAHVRGLIHRDLKPDNVFLDESGGVRRVKLLDFGVVKEIDPHQTSGTGTGAVGSPMWMAPEQTSAGGRIAPATDVWAFGLLSYFVLTGSLYWKAGIDDSGVAGLLREMHIEPIEAPSLRVELTAPGKKLPPKFDDWFAAAVARDSNARFRTASAALEALRPVLADVTGRAHTTEIAFMTTLDIEPADVARFEPQVGGGTNPMGSQNPDDYKPADVETSRTIAGVAGLVASGAVGGAAGETDDAATIPASSELAAVATAAVEARRAEAELAARREAAREEEARREALGLASTGMRSAAEAKEAAHPAAEPKPSTGGAPWEKPPPQWSELPPAGQAPARQPAARQPAAPFKPAAGGVVAVPLKAPPLPQSQAPHTAPPLTPSPSIPHEMRPPAETYIPNTDPPPPGKDGPSLLVWVAVVLVIGLLVSVLSGVIVWIVLMITDPSPARDRDRTDEIRVGALYDEPPAVPS